MSTITTRFSHAAPYLRERFIDKVRTAHAARTQRDRKAAFAAAYAYYDALKIMTTSGDVGEVAAEAIGLPESTRFDRADAEQIKAFLGEMEYRDFAIGADLEESYR